MPDSPEPELHGLDPGELLARGLNTVRPTSGVGNWLPPAPEELARLLPQYQIESLLGHGGMGAVYKGTQVALDRAVAIKLLPAEVAADEQFIARFQREARTLARLHHPGIVAVHDFGQTSEGHLYFVMEYVDGTDLHRLLQSSGLNPAQALEILGQVCTALHYAHSQGVIHRDIKPANILITRSGEAKLADFGLARPGRASDASAITSTNMVMGTPDYMAPEQRRGLGDHRADIYALGVMLYEMLTGETPRGIFERPSQKVRLDVRIDQVVIRALQAEPARRYQRVSEMKTDVDRIRTPVPERVALPAAAPVAPSAGTRTIALAAIIAVLLGVITFLVLKKDAARNSPNAAGEAPALASTEPATVEKPSPAPKPITAAPATTPIPSTPSPITIVAAKTEATPRPNSTPAPTPIPPPAITPAPPVAVARLVTPIATTPTPVAAPSQIEILKQQGPNISAWVTSPLDTVVPDAIWQNLTFMKEELRDEAARKPVASATAYGTALRLCALMLDDLAARKVAQTEAGGPAALHQTSQLTEWRRDHLTWPMYSLEHDERTERKQWAAQNSPRMLAWQKRTNDMRYELGVWYNKFREALRQSPLPPTSPR